jgi:hypothetical protein
MARHAKGFMPGRHSLGGFFSGLVYRPRVRATAGLPLGGRYVAKHRAADPRYHAYTGGGRSFFTRGR